MTDAQGTTGNEATPWDDDRIVDLVSSYSNLRVSGVECMSKAGVMFLLATMRDDYEARITESAADANELNSIRKVAQERLGTIAAQAARIAALEQELAHLRKTGCYPMTQMASGQVTADWDNPQEDEAWKNL